MLYEWLALASALLLSTVSGDHMTEWVKRRPIHPKSGKQMNLWHLGWSQFLAHDAFRVKRGDRVHLEGTENLENGWFDMSILLRDNTDDMKPFECDRIRTGGGFRQRENFMLFSVASFLGNHYCDMLDADYSVEDSYAHTMQMYEAGTRELYKKLFRKEMKSYWNGDCHFKHEENLAWRVGHAMLPGKVQMDDGSWVPTMAVPRTQWPEHTLRNMWSKPLDGYFAPEFLNMQAGPSTFSLLDADHSYGEQFKTHEPFQQYLDEANRWRSFRHGMVVTRRIQDFFHRGLYCARRNKHWNPPKPQMPYRPKYEVKSNLWDMGVLQLMAHDMHNVDRSIPHQFENGWLDLSTLLKNMKDGGKPWNCEEIVVGGERRNSDGIMLRSVSNKLGRYYCENLYIHGYKPRKAYFKTLRLYHSWAKDSYERVFEEKMPLSYRGDDCEPTHAENVAFRTVHSLLPQNVKYPDEDKWAFPLDVDRLETWSEEYLRSQKAKAIDGKFAPGYLEMRFGPTFVVNLLEKDTSYAVQFGVERDFPSLLKELAYDGKYRRNSWSMQQIRKMIAKGIHCMKREKGWYNKPYALPRAEYYPPADYKPGDDIDDDDYIPAWKPQY